MSKGSTLQLYESGKFLNRTAATGTGEEDVYILTGSRAVLSFRVKSIDPGATIKLQFKTRVDVDDEYELIEEISVSQAGLYKRVYSDFNRLFTLGYEVVNGSADFFVGLAIFDNSSFTTIENAELSVALKAVADAQGRYDSVRVGDGQYELKVNPDGSLSVTVGDTPGETGVNIYEEVENIVSGLETVVATYTVPSGVVAYLQRVEASSENISKYQVVINGEPVATKRTHHATGLNVEFEFLTAIKKPLILHSGDILQVVVVHNRPNPCPFEARIQVIEKA